MVIVDYLLRAVIVGGTATLSFDLWSLLLQRLSGAPAPDWGLLGRWICHLGSGKVMHANIRASAPVRYERAIGWLAHYAVGTVFALMLLLGAGADWARHPTLVPALLVGLATIVFVWCILMPVFGHGVAASKSPIANRIRGINVVSHVVLGVGFYAGALLAQPLLSIVGHAS